MFGFLTEIFVCVNGDRSFTTGLHKVLISVNDIHSNELTTEILLKLSTNVCSLTGSVKCPRVSWGPLRSRGAGWTLGTP